MMTRRKLLIAVIVAIFSVSLLAALTTSAPKIREAQADDASMFVASTEIRLGMPKEPLLSSLRSRYVLTQSNTDSYFFWEGTGSGAKLLGGVAFRNDRVSWVSRAWGSFCGTNTLKFATELHSALDSLQSASGRPVVAYASKTHGAPGLRITAIQFSSGTRQLTLSIAEGDEAKAKSGECVSLQETLSAK
jgi:hypothetical protein